MSADGQRTKWRRNIVENFNRLSRVHERYTQTTDGRTTTKVVDQSPTDCLPRNVIKYTSTTHDERAVLFAVAEPLVISKF